ncbi:MAG: hypothetical protein AAFV71_12375 [Cyanobacteria bacterium J06633_8]
MKRLIGITSALAVSTLGFAVPALAKPAIPSIAKPSIANTQTARSTISICGGSPDCIKHDLKTQATCTLKGSDNKPLAATRDRRWVKGLNTEMDNKILQGDVVAYKIQWFNGSWSGWYVTGVNDIDWKFNRSTNDMRRMWSYFSDHKHQYIICNEP